MKISTFAPCPKPSQTTTHSWASSTLPSIKLRSWVTIPQLRIRQAPAQKRSSTRPSSQRSSSDHQRQSNDVFPALTVSLSSMGYVFGFCPVDPPADPVQLPALPVRPRQRRRGSQRHNIHTQLRSDGNRSANLQDHVQPRPSHGGADVEEIPHHPPGATSCQENRVRVQ